MSSSQSLPQAPGFLKPLRATGRLARPGGFTDPAINVASLTEQLNGRVRGDRALTVRPPDHDPSVRHILALDKVKARDARHVASLLSDHRMHPGDADSPRE